MARLSAPAREALALAVRHGGLVRHDSARDGWWTYPGCPWVRPWGVNYKRPETKLSPVTLRSLARAGLLAADGPDRFEATPEGRRALGRESVLDEEAERARPVAFAATARVHLADGTVLHAGLVHDPERLDDGGREVDAVLHASPDAAAAQTVGRRQSRVADAPGGEWGTRSEPDYGRETNPQAEGVACLVPYEDLEFAVVEADDPVHGPEWWGALVHRRLGLVCAGAHSREASYRPGRGPFRPVDGATPGVEAAGPPWEDLPFEEWGAALGVPPGTAEGLAMAGRNDPSPTMLKALRLAEDGGLVRLKGGFWTHPGCPVREVRYADGPPERVPQTYVDVRTVEACVRRGLLAKGPAYDAPASLTDAGRDLVASEGYGAPGSRGP